MAYKPPYYVTIGLYFMVKTPDNQIAGVPMAIEEVGDLGLGVLIEKAISNLRNAGLIPLTQEEYDTWARSLAQREQTRQLDELMRDHVKGRALDPARLEAILVGHKGRSGGDA